MLTWILFLKFLDDHELIREDRAKMKKEKFRPIIESPYRWRDWAAKEDGISGDALLSFINHDKATLPDGSDGKGLIAYMRSLQAGAGTDQRDVVRMVFTGITNRMESGYLLRDVINAVNAIHLIALKKSTHSVIFMNPCSRRCVMLPEIPVNSTRPEPWFALWSMFSTHSSVRKSSIQLVVPADSWSRPLLT